MLFVSAQMGMGKTACAVGAIQLNPPPEDWRKNRSYQSLRARDHLCELAALLPAHWAVLAAQCAVLSVQWLC